ncbi:MAG: hypothetical protein QOF40_1876, partial [Actinomycetota bacterium]|nr:hypothetical protein [Actinomycetota bacterium]
MAPAPHGSRLPYLPGLDGVRALAALAVLFFHGGFSWARGGYLGVSLFFTLSGFLITRMLLAGYASEGRIDLLRFWAGRFRRLAPALLITLAAVIVVGPYLWDPTQRASLTGDVESSIAYVANWRFIFSGNSYADLFRTASPVQHCWSIAIEEQFYLVFPIVMAVTLWATHGSRRALRNVLLGAAAISLALPFVLANHDRVYYGTDTRAFEILAGCLLAFSFLHRPRGAMRRWWPVLGFTGLVVTVAAWMTVPQTSGWLYRGGFALLAVVNVFVLRGAIVAGPVRSLLSVRPLRLIGKISYGLYLYHWPIFLWLDPVRVGVSGMPLFVLRMAVTFAVALASFVFVEMPIRERRIFRTRGYGPAVVGSIAAIVLVAILVVPASSGVSSTVGRDLSRNLPTPIAAASSTPTAGADRPLRVYIYGDSTGDQFALGLYDWSLQHPDRVAVKANAHHSCALADFDTIRFSAGNDVAEDDCKTDRAKIPGDLASFRPDVVFVMSGVSNATDVKLPGDDTWRALGDPAVDSFMLQGMNTLATEVAAQAIPTVWFDLPNSDGSQYGSDFVAADHARINRYNALVDQLAAQQHSVVRMHWADHINAFGAELDRTMRPDGIHVLPERLGELLDSWLWPELR